MDRHPDHGKVSAETAAAWVQEVARFSFSVADRA